MYSNGNGTHNQKFLYRSPTIILLICLLTFGVYFAYDIPAAISDRFKKLGGGSETNYELLYTMYSIPSMIAPILFGALADSYFGPHLCATISTLLVTVACIIIAVGCTINNYATVLTGRFVMGISGESIFALQQTLSSWWIDESLQPLAMSFAIASGALGEITNFLFTPRLFHTYGFKRTQWFAVGICSVSVLAGTILYFLSTLRPRVLLGPSKANIEKHNKKTNRTHPHSAVGGRPDDNLIHDGPRPPIGSAYIGFGDVDEGFTVERTTGDFTSKDFTEVSFPQFVSEDQLETHQQDFNWQAVVKFETLLLYGINMCTMSAFYIFPSIVEDYMKQIHQSGASTMNVMLYSIPLIISPLIGWCVGSHSLKRLAELSVLGNAMATIGFLFLALETLTVSPFVALSILALGCSILTATLTPSIAFTVPTYLHGSAFGMWSCTQSAATVLYSVVIGVLVDQYSTKCAVLFLCFGAALGSLLNVILVYYITNYLTEKKRMSRYNNSSCSSFIDVIPSLDNLLLPKEDD